jgi:hypothetical protein
MRPGSTRSTLVTGRMAAGPGWACRAFSAMTSPGSSTAWVLGSAALVPGDHVMAMTHFPDGTSGYAELAVVDADLAAPIGSATSFAPQA